MSGYFRVRYAQDTALLDSRTQKGWFAIFVVALACYPFLANALWLDLANQVLLGVVGAVALDRLALHSLSLGYSQPLTGVWVTEPEAPRILRVRSGNDVLAELVDVDRDDRVEMLYVLTLD